MMMSYKNVVKDLKEIFWAEGGAILGSPKAM
jgi:hypothetical protein